MKVYISGPITGIPNSNRPAFAEAAQILRLAGHEPVNPIELDHSHDGPCRGSDIPDADHRPQPPSHKYGCYLKADILALMDCDAIMFLEGWQFSRGARTEGAVAGALGIKQISLRTLRTKIKLEANP